MISRVRKSATVVKLLLSVSERILSYEPGRRAGRGPARVGAARLRRPGVESFVRPAGRGRAGVGLSGSISEPRLGTGEPERSWDRLRAEIIDLPELGVQSRVDAASG